MKLEIDTDRNTVSSVAEKTGTLEAVASATRVFLGTAIGFGFAVSSLAFAWFPKTQLSSSTTTVRNQPLQIMDVVRAVSVRDPMETQAYTTQRYFAGRTEVYVQAQQYGVADSTYRTARQNESLAIYNSNLGTNTNSTSRGPAFGIPTAHAQATSFSIEPIDSGFRAQYIFIAYRKVGDVADRYLTVCLGSTTATQVYVGSDGSTYTDSRLQNRTTQRSCAELQNMNQGVEWATDGSIFYEPTNRGEYVVVKSVRPFGRFQDGVFQPNEPLDLGLDLIWARAALNHYRTPIWMGFNPTSSEEVPAQLVVPSAFVRLVDDGNETQLPGQQTLCGPAWELNPDGQGPVMFFDRDGNAYRDFFLTERVTTINCPDILANSLTMGDLENLTATPSAWDFGGVYLHQGQHTLGMVSSSSLPFPTYTDGDIVNEPIGPLSLVGGRNAPDPQSGTIPKLNIVAIGTAAGQSRTDLLCYPETSVPTWQPNYSHLTFYYFDRSGRPFTDSFLTEPANCGSPGGIEPIGIE